MNILKQLQAAATESLRAFLRTFVYDINVPHDIREMANTINAQIQRCNSALMLRHYLLATINNVSPVWRRLAPYTSTNKLLTHLEEVVNNAKFSEHNILLMQNTELHEHYLQQQRALLRPLNHEISELKAANKTLTASVSELQQENKRLRIENDFLMKEMQQMFERISGKLNNIEQQTKPQETPDTTRTPTMVH